MGSREPRAVVKQLKLQKEWRAGDGRERLGNGFEGNKKIFCIEVSG